MPEFYHYSKYVLNNMSDFQTVGYNYISFGVAQIAYPPVRRSAEYQLLLSHTFCAVNSVAFRKPEALAAWTSLPETVRCCNSGVIFGDNLTELSRQLPTQRRAPHLAAPSSPALAFSGSNGSRVDVARYPLPPFHSSTPS